CSGTRWLPEFLLGGSRLLISWTILGNTAEVLVRLLGCIGICAEHPVGMWSPLQGRCSSFRVGYFGGFRLSDHMILTTSAGRWLLGGRGICRRRTRRPLAYSSTRFVWRPYMTPEVAPPEDPRPSADYLRWWYLARKRFLAPEDAFHQRRPDEIPIEATQRVTITAPRATQVDDVPDRSRPDRRRMVGTRTTARYWQWVEDMMRQDLGAPRRGRRMPEGGGRQRVGIGRGRGGDKAPSAQT
ncbi:hypothetical protein PIB30_072158, partial [Stylosanthes scabra]|nr:hypothetical protein [Stylosanthes scabra]